MEDIVKYIVTSIVSHPEDVNIVTEQESEKVFIIRVSVNTEDLGRVIGKNGKVANAIRTVIRSASNKSGKKFIVKIA